MEIAKGIDSESYLNLNLKDYTSPDWELAIKILDKRLTERYIEPVEILLNAENGKEANDKKFGFTILAVDCLLVETLQSFYEGITDSSRISARLFKNFLQQRASFKAYFSSDSDVKCFYENYRCGILHQAQTFKNAKIWTVGKLYYRLGDDFIINRNAFHEALKMEKDIYIDILGSKKDKILLDNFKKKMDFIAS